MKGFLNNFVREKEIELQTLQKEVPILKSIRDVSKLKLEESLSLFGYEATMEQLREMTSAIFDIAKAYDYQQFPKTLPKERKPYIPDVSDGNDPSGLLLLTLVSKYLINVIKAIGGEEKFYKKLRGPDNRPTMQEMHYVWVIIAIEGYAGEVKGYKRPERKDLLVESVNTAKKLLDI